MRDETGKNPIVVMHDGGVRFAAQVRSHRLVVDQPRNGGGQDAGPKPIELLGVALGTCVAYYVQQFLHVRGLPCVGMRVEVEQRSERNPNRISEFVVRVQLPGELPKEYLDLLERVVRSCPAHNTLERAASVRVSIETPSPALT
jgi:uncharacterized OsmC-like protein